MITTIIGNSVVPQRQDQHLDASDKSFNFQIEQEKIYRFLVKIVQEWEPEKVLEEFKSLFIDCLDSVNVEPVPGIYKFFICSNEMEFRNTLKRCCYILINNWQSTRNSQYISKLLKLFAEYQPQINATSHKIIIFRKWLENFIESSDYQELKLFAAKNEDDTNEHWVNRYSSYLLVAQFLEKNNSPEQKEAAIRLSKYLKDKFKFELAMYIARSQSATCNVNRYKNPSILGDEVLRLIKAIIVKKGSFSCKNIANIFIQQTKNQTFKDFKINFYKYLTYSIHSQKFIDTLKQLSKYLSSWKTEYNQEKINENLILRTGNKVIDYLTTENGSEPSGLFILLLSQENPLSLVILLLKIILISKNSRGHLEMRIAQLIRYYEKYSEADCQWIINFMEIFNITFAIYAENIEYNLIKMKSEGKIIQAPQLNMDTYRVFSQLRCDESKC